MRTQFRASLLAAAMVIAPAASAHGGLDLGHLAKVATVDARFQSYNVEMVEVTGGRFWAPYGGPAGEMFRQRPPLDLTDPRLLAYAKALAPAYMRVSGTWSNNTYLPAEGETVTAPPTGFKQVLTRAQWRNVVAFSRAADAPIVTSFAVTTGTRGLDGVWQPLQAQRLADLTREAGGTIAAAEFFNEPNIPGAGAPMPADYDAAKYAADFRVFHYWARQALPKTLLLGTGGANEATINHALPVEIFGKPVHSADMLAANPGQLDGLSYHFYGNVSQRCGRFGGGSAQEAEALTPAWLDRTLIDYRFYAALRDRYEPGKPIWNTETGQAACGGSPWASTFLDTFRYVNQLGVLAQAGVQVVIHNTLATSDYALLDRDTMTARPSYWAAVLWRRVMGRTVLASPTAPAPQVRIYAHCLRGKPGGVGLVALNIGDRPAKLHPGKTAQGWVLTGTPTTTRDIRVNGQTPGLGADGQLTGLDGVATGTTLTLPARAIAFVAVPDAGNPACGADQ